MLYAIVATGGKQYRVQRGQIVEVGLLPVEAGQEVELDRVYAVGGEGDLIVGQPTVPGAKVRATVLRQDRARKIIVFKHHSKKRYRRKAGHRQPFTRLRVEDILVR